MARLATVIVPPLDKPLTYLVPESVTIAVGYYVVVPLGGRQAYGFVIALEDKVPDRALKEIAASVSTAPAFHERDLEFFIWMANFYGTSLAAVLETAVPAVANPEKTETVSLIAGSDTSKLKGALQKSLVETLVEGPQTTSALRKRMGNIGAPLKRLVELGIATITEVYEKPWVTQARVASWALSSVQLSPSQEEATNRVKEAIDKDAHTTFLLHGATGSGKTEVYIEAAIHALKKNPTKGVLFLVPEIALTPQLVDRISGRLNQPIAVLHSGLSTKERWFAWSALYNGDARVALGARSALFAPMGSLGLIIIDEEHEGSFKQSDSLRYNARDLAQIRARAHKCPVILGSATPSLESYHNAVTGKYTLLPLVERRGVDNLKIETINLKSFKPWEMSSKHLTPPLFEAIQQTIKDGDQIFILLNRRGYATFLECTECSTAVQCPQCSVTLTFHQQRGRILCHHCGFSSPRPQHCSSCKGAGKESPLEQHGFGTELVEEELRSLFPEAPLARLDRDTVESIETYQGVLDQVRERKIQILVGTQMIAKGHDLPDVTLVGVIDADVGLHMPDFRAAERIFGLLTQVAGRAGRSKKQGRALIQTRMPQHPSLVYTTKSDYIGFAKHELLEREKFRFPPFSRLLRILCAAHDEEQGTELLRNVKRAIEQLKLQIDPTVQVLGPAAAPLMRLKGLWRSHLILRATTLTPLVRIQKILRESIELPKNTRLSYDLEPQDMM